MNKSLNVIFFFWSFNKISSLLGKSSKVEIKLEEKKNSTILD